MKANILQIIVYCVFFIIQLKIPIASGQRTFFSYILPWFLIIPRCAYLVRIFGFPVNKKFAPIGECIIYVFTMFFFLMALYKKHFKVNVIGIVVNILITIIVISIEIVESMMYVYVYESQEEVNKDDV